MSEWMPLSAREGHMDYEALYEGIPPWLVRSLRDWVRARVAEWSPRQSQWVFSDAVLQAVERSCRITLNWIPPGVQDAGEHLLTMVSEDPEAFLDAVDYLVGLSTGESAFARAQLEVMLTQSGSVWTVSDAGNRTHLERRVAPVVAAAAREAMSRGEPGRLLGEAWGHFYGRKPDESKAYSLAVKAIEAAAHAVVIPDDSGATLGKMIAAMRAKSAKWEVATEAREPVASVIAIMDLIWTGQTDRHGFEGGVRDLVPGAAETAVHLAVALVPLFSSGLIRRKVG